MRTYRYHHGPDVPPACSSSARIVWARSAGSRRLDVLTGWICGAPGDLRRLLPAPAVAGDEPTESTAAVRAILDRVRAEGDLAVRELTWQFDGVAVDDLRVPPSEVKAALDAIPAELRAALEAAHDNIVAYHRTQLHPDGR